MLVVTVPQSSQDAKVLERAFLLGETLPCVTSRPSSGTAMTEMRVAEIAYEAGMLIADLERASDRTES